MLFPFSDHIGLLKQMLDSRRGIVGELEDRLFGVQGKEYAKNGDRESIADILNACFFESQAIAHLSPLSGQLEAAHAADGFEPAGQDGYARELDPVELVLRAHHYWDGTRWPGTKARLSYAQTLYTVFILRQLERLSLRIWDEGDEWAAERLQQVQLVLDLLNATSRSAHAIRLVSDARWLIQTAQGPLTRHPAPYFAKAARVSALPDEIRLEVNKAGAMLAGGHLRSQLRHLSRRTGWASDDPQLLALTRQSNSMDMALLVHDLVPLLREYIAICERQEDDSRRVLADAILQGLSADPELLLTRLDLLVPSTMIEDLFVDRGDAGASRYTAVGESHREYLMRYGELVGCAADALQQDSRTFDPARADYSPLGSVYGFCADLYSNMVLNTLPSASSPDMTLEDLFNSRERLEEKRAQAEEWKRLPKRAGEPDPFEHSNEWGARMHARLAGALEARAARPAEPNPSRNPKSRLFVVLRGVADDSLPDNVLPAGVISGQEHCLTSDLARARASGGTALPASRLVADRAEGRFLACVHSEGAWFGISKVALTLFTSQGKDALFADVPAGLTDVLRRVCPELLVVIGEDDGQP